METNNVDFTFLIPYLDKISKNGYYYNPKRILMHKKPFNVSQSGRSIGKTTEFMCIVVLNYLLKKNEFLYVRRTDPETLEGARDFFNDIDILKEACPEFEIKNVYYHAGKFYIEFNNGTKEEIGRTMPLSFVGKRKSSKPKNCNIILYDEFVAMYNKEYLGTSDDITEEYDRLILLYQTIDRKKGKTFRNETAIFCLGNSTTIYNPIFLGLNCLKYMQEDSKFICPKDSFYCVERIDKVEATKDIENSFGYIMASDINKQKMYKNNTGEFNNRYIDNNKPKQSVLLCNFILDKYKYGFYYSQYTMLYYIGKGESTGETYSLDIEGHEMSDTEYVKAMSKFKWSSVITNAYSYGRLFFNSIITQRKILSYLKLI